MKKSKTKSKPKKSENQSLAFEELAALPKSAALAAMAAKFGGIAAAVKRNPRGSKRGVELAQQKERAFSKASAKAARKEAKKGAR